MAATFTEDDLKIYRELVGVLSEAPPFSIKLSEVGKYNRCLRWLAELGPKMEAHLLEIRNVHHADGEIEPVNAAPEVAAKTQRKSRSTKKAD
jgi:hypothetical protein